MSHTEKKVVAFVPAKGTSSRIENKNSKLLDGKPLFLHAIEKLMACDFIDEVYLDTESDEFIRLATPTGCQILKRDPKLASNRTDGNQLLLNEIEQVEADVYVQMLCTSPFIQQSTLSAAVEAVRSGKHDSAVLVSRQKQYTWDPGGGGPTYDVEHIPNSVDLPDTVIETMGLYVIERGAALSTRRRIGDSPLQVEATAIEAVDVNWPDDFELANYIASGMREAERKLYGNIKAHLSSSLLSDCMDGLGIDGVVSGFRPNIPSAKVFGHVKTLRIRAIAEGESPEGIYRALESYSTIIPGDVIVVENEVPHLAYFGELNANLAIRAGAAGALIGGVTRDSAEVERLGFPVFSKGYTCKDVRNRAVLDHYNLPIEFQGISVNPGDLVFADRDGLVFIPQRRKKEVLDAVFRTLSTEKRILVDIAIGVNEEKLVEHHGTF